MLAITKESAYEVCIIQDNSGNCIRECSGTIVYDVNGNKCEESSSISCPYLIVPEGICSETCDPYIYVIKDNFCGLCRDLYSSKKYKIINGTDCLSEIPEGAEVFNPNLFLLTCKSGYIVNGSICIPHCYESCEKCSEYSTDENDQKWDAVCK